MRLEDKLASWTGPSSETEQSKQDRTERMIREAIKEHAAFDSCGLTVYAKGSYANNTNVMADSDVDIAVQCGDLYYWDGENKETNNLSTYTGIWTPKKLRSELQAALQAKFPGQVDSSGSTAFRINSSSARVDADVVPCFNYRYYLSSGGYLEGAKIFKKNGSGIENYPSRQLENGRAKNVRTKQYYKKAVRVMKRIENAMVVEDVHREVPSYFVECLVYRCPDYLFLKPTWTEIVRGIIAYIWNGLDGAEPSVSSDRWLEVNECKYLFHDEQAWTRADGRAFVKAAWNYLGLAS